MALSSLRDSRLRTAGIPSTEVVGYSLSSLSGLVEDEQDPSSGSEGLSRNIRMSLLYKPDWEETKERYLAWWAHEYFGRCALSVTAPKDDPPDAPRPPAPKTIQEQWYDLDLINERQQYHMARAFHGGEALPVWNAGYPGNTSIPVFMGTRIELDWNTGWTEGKHLLDGDDLDFQSLRIDKEHPEYRFALETLRRGAKGAKGKCLVTVGAFGGCGDTLASLRGSQPLLFDCMDRPEWVRAAEEYLMDVWCEHYDVLYEIIREADEGSTCWFTLWSPGKFYASQNDFSYMISPQMFRDIFLPIIAKQTEFLDHSVYHVDGIAAFAHVDALCELPNLQAYQILPGAGKPSPLHYMDTLKEVQAAGRNLWISIPIDEVESALEQLSARGLYIATSAKTEEEARDLLKKVEEWSVDRG